MPTTQPRYQVTDTGRVRTLLDRAAAAWPDLAGNRKALLVRLAETGAEHLPPPSLTAPELDLRRHVGDWVALRDGALLVAAPDAEAVVTWLRAHGERADQVFRVPADDAAIAAAHGAA